ncbi:MAG: hypothetical protein J7L45_02060, partial [Candidatus Aenigmarchaeota archaeon]|nr:hypothetical protein [Candidatus Aenigmarchaeota archaeon]
MSENSTGKKSKWDWLSTASTATIGVMVLLLAVMIIGIGQGEISSSHGITGMITAEDANQKALDVIKNHLVPPGTQVSIDSIKEISGIYEINLTVKLNGRDQKFTSYMTKDGKLFFPQGIDIDSLEEEQQQTQEQQSPQPPKSDKP